MQQIYLNFGFHGYTRLMKYISNIAHLGAKDQLVIKHRLHVIEHFEKFGKDSTKSAFGVSKSTIYAWKTLVEKAGGYLSALKPQSKVPHIRTQRVRSAEVDNFIIQYRKLHPGVSKVTVKAALDAYCIALGIKSVSESTVGRIIGELKDKGLIPSYTVTTTMNARTGDLRVRTKKPGQKKLRVKKGFRPKVPGELVQVDAITVYIYNIKRYIICALDIKTKFAFAYAYKTLSSDTAKDFLMKLESVAPFHIQAIQTDNGKEFMKHFRDYAQVRGLTHYYNYPNYPKMNSFVERFNRTIQEQHIGWHMNDLYEPNEFNLGLMKYLVWYNTEKPHTSLGKLPPLKYYLDNFVDINQSSMLWTSTLG